MIPFYQGRTIRRLIIFISQHPVGLLRMTWEGLYVALSRVKYRDHIRLAIKRNDRCTMQYISNLEKDKYTRLFFLGYGPESEGDHGMERGWDRTRARNAANFKTKVSKAKRKKKPVQKHSPPSIANKRKRVI